MIIAVKLVRKPRINRVCQACFLPIGVQPSARLFGCGERGDPPYAIYLHWDCALTSPHPDVQRLLKKGESHVSYTSRGTRLQPGAELFHVKLTYLYPDRPHLHWEGQAALYVQRWSAQAARTPLRHCAAGYELGRGWL